MFAFSSSLSMSWYEGMPLPPVLICARTLASVTGFPFVRVFFLKSPCSEGPIFFSGESTLWQTAHCSKDSLPFEASPFCGAAFELPATPTAMNAQSANEVATAEIRRIIMNRFRPRDEELKSFGFSLQPDCETLAREISDTS